MGKKGYIVVSLDFELLWGVHDHETKESFAKQIDGARAVIPQLLELFKEYGIHATWGIVGMLMASNREELLECQPTELPTYSDPRLSTYNHITEIGENEQEDHFHYASSLVNLIATYNNQEIGSHTFSHFCCKADGQTVAQFSADLDCAQSMMEKKTGRKARSLIFPRNQFTEEYATAASKKGFQCVRGNPKSYAYNNGKKKLARVIRFLDTYLNVCGMKCSSLEDCKRDSHVIIPASRFFRKFDTRFPFLEKVKVACIKRQMSYAARKGKIFHLWWHPHNVSINSDKSLEQLRDLFEYYRELNRQYGFESRTMQEMAEAVCLS